MRIHHLINGKPVEGREYFETVNPATQEVLAEVAAGTADDVNAAVAAAKGRVPAVGRHAGRRTREADGEAGRADREARARDQRAGDEGHRPGPLADAQAAGAAGGRQLPLFRRDVHAGGRPHPTRRPRT